MVLHISIQVACRIVVELGSAEVGHLFPGCGKYAMTFRTVDLEQLFSLTKNFYYFLPARLGIVGRNIVGYFVAMVTLDKTDKHH